MVALQVYRSSREVDCLDFGEGRRAAQWSRLAFNLGLKGESAFPRHFVFSPGWHQVGGLNYVKNPYNSPILELVHQKVLLLYSRTRLALLVVNENLLRFVSRDDAPLSCAFRVLVRNDYGLQKSPTATRFL